MKLTDIIFEKKNIDNLEKELQKEFNNKLGIYQPDVRVGEYSQPRPEGDPNKDRGYGHVEFIHRDKNAIPENDFNTAISMLKGKNFEIKEESNTYEMEPGEGEDFPIIKFEFDLKK